MPMDAFAVAEPALWPAGPEREPAEPRGGAPADAAAMWQWWQVYVEVMEAGASPYPRAPGASWPAGGRDEQPCADPGPVRWRARRSPAEIGQADAVQGWLIDVMRPGQRWSVSTKAVRATYLRAAGLDGRAVARIVRCRNCRMQYKRWRDGLMASLLEAARRASVQNSADAAI